MGARMSETRVAVDLLTDEKFTQVTEWELRGEKIKPAGLDWFDSSGWLYAFVLQSGVVRYVGLTEHILRSRLDHYSYGPQTTNKRVRQSIAFELKRNCPVIIYGRSEPDAARRQAEEKRLIRSFNPAWNRLIS